MNNKTNQGILPFQMVKLAAGEWESWGSSSAPKPQSVYKINADGSRTSGILVGDKFIPGKYDASSNFEPAKAKQKGQGTLDLFATGNGFRNADGVLGKTPIEAARDGKSKKRGFLSTLLRSTGRVIKNHPVDTSLVAGSVATPVLYNLLGDDNSSSESSEAPKAEAKAEPKSEAPKAEPKVEQPKAEPAPVTTTPTNGTGGDGGRTTTITTVTKGNSDFIDQGLQAINDFKAKHPELFWSGVGLAGLGSIYALSKALDDDDDDDDYYYYRHR